MYSNILLLFNSEMAIRHPQFPLLKSFWDNKHRTRLIMEAGRVSVDDCFYVFYLFCHYAVVHGANIFFVHRGTQRDIESLHIGIHDMRRPF
jgi:hypothetical protein